MEQAELKQRKQKAAASLLAAAAAAVFVMASAGCNTTEGAGKDIKSLGAGIEEAADDAKD